VIISSSRTVIASPTISPTFTLAPTQTPDLSMFENSNTKRLITPDGLLAIRLAQPPWRMVRQQVPGFYTLSVGPTGNLGAELFFGIGQPETVTKSILGLSATESSPQAAIDAFLPRLAPSVFRVNPVSATKIGTVDGYGLRYSNVLPINAYAFDLRLAALPDGRWLYVLARARLGVSEQAQPVLEAMIASIEVLPSSVPTATATVIIQSGP
jgi:hypothetical protein